MGTAQRRLTERPEHRECGPKQLQRHLGTFASRCWARGGTLLLPITNQGTVPQTNQSTAADPLVSLQTNLFWPQTSWFRLLCPADQLVRIGCNGLWAVTRAAAESAHVPMAKRVSSDREVSFTFKVIGDR